MDQGKTLSGQEAWLTGEKDGMVHLTFWSTMRIFSNQNFQSSAQSKARGLTIIIGTSKLAAALISVVRGLHLSQLLAEQQTPLLPMSGKAAQSPETTPQAFILVQNQLPHLTRTSTFGWLIFWKAVNGM